MARLGVSPAVRRVVRERLLDSLPDTSPFVVTLEAPAGFGKTSLLADWAARLAGEGWRTLHVAQRGRDLCASVAAALGLPPGADWGALERELWCRPTLLAVDDLDQAECADQLEVLLEGMDGLLALASRRPLSSAGLVAAALRGRLMTLGPEDLAFDAEEAAALLQGSGSSADVIAETAGWPLLVAYAANTGSPPPPAVVARSVRTGVTDAAWRRLLLQAAVPDAAAELGGDAWRASVAELEAAGFLEVVGAAPRLVPAVAMALLASCADEVRRAVRTSASLLSERQLCAAHEATQDLAALAAALDGAASPLERDDPRSLLRWHEAAPPTTGGSRRVKVGNALCAVGRREEGVALLLAAAEDGDLDPDTRLTALGDAIYFLAEAPEDRDAARALLAGSGTLYDAATPERQGRFLSTASAVHFRSGEFADAKRLVERALEVLPTGNRHRYAPLMNLAVLEWNLDGDIEARLRLQHEGLEICRAEYPDHVVGVCRDLAQLCLYLGRVDRAREYLREARSLSAARPVIAHEVEAMQAQLDGDLDRLWEVLDEARGQGDESVVDAVASRLVTVMTRVGLASRATSLFGDDPPGAFTAVALALAQLALGERAAAERRLAACRDDGAERELRLTWQAASFRVTRSERDLDELCGMTSAGARVLPYFVPLGELPRDRPELAADYPLREVMLSGWSEAASLRSDDLPPLKVTSLGGLSVEVLGDEVELSGKQRDLLALLLLGLGRRELGAALWPEAEPSRARNNLNVQLSELRRTIEPWGARTYLHEDGLRRVDSDLSRLQGALADGRGDEVMALYRGPFAPGAGSEAVLEFRAVLEREVVDALVEAATRAQPRSAVAYLKRALRLEPLNEEALQRLLETLVAMGRRAEAMRHYRRFADDLRDQLGVEPLPETTRAVHGDAPSR